MAPLKTSVTRLPEKGQRRLADAARRAAYRREGKLLYWSKFLALFCLGSASLGISTGIIIAIFGGSPSGQTVAVIVGAIAAAIAFHKRIENWLLRKYIH